MEPAPSDIWMPEHILVFSLDGRHYALPLERVERVMLSVDLTPLPGAPDVIIGAFDMQGAVVPVVEFRNRLKLPARDISVSDKFIITRMRKRSVAVRVDEIRGVVECDPGQIIPPHSVAPGLENVTGILRLGDGIVLIYDIDGFLSIDEEKALDESANKVMRDTGR